MRQNISQTQAPRTLNEDELDAVIGGVASQIVASPVWVSPLAIHGFNPQPDPPAVAPIVAPEH